MSETPGKAQFDVPAQILPAVIGPVASRLLSNDTLILFDAETAAIVSANDAAVTELGLDLDNAIQPVFAEMTVGANDDPNIVWAQLDTGQDCTWVGTVNGAVGFSKMGTIWTTACTDADGKKYVLLCVSEVVDAPVQPSSSPIEDVVGTVLFDIEGKILELNAQHNLFWGTMLQNWLGAITPRSGPKMTVNPLSTSHSGKKSGPVKRLRAITNT